MTHINQRTAIASQVMPSVDCVFGQLFGERAGIDTSNNLTLKEPPM